MPQLFTSEFNIECNIPPGVFEAFMAAQAKLLRVRGCITKTAEGFKGHIEGEKESMEKLQNVIDKAEKFASQMKVKTFSQLKEIKEYTVNGFEVK